ncbi:MAG: hypothetical protein HYU29_00685 [Chloroflexi bacterium]|nr:hypothetical protein [Chloroflexota bacterium]
MASITNATLTITHNHTKKTARPIVKCKVNFTTAELALMKLGGTWFKLKCQLWGEDSGFTGADDYLYTYSTVYYFPDVTPAASEDRTFDVTVGEGVLDEDWGVDEVYGKLILQNLVYPSTVTKKTNVVSHSF